MRPLVLVVDDEVHMRQLVRIYLDNAGYDTAEASDGMQALEQLAHQTFHLVILDVMMPGMDGWQTCSEIRSHYPAIPILMLTAHASIEDKVAGLRMGADDYLTKPFDGRELVARVQALLRRMHTHSDVIEFDRIALRIDIDGHDASVNDHSMSLTPKEFDLLLLFAQHPGRSFSREELLARVWGMDYEGGTRTVDSHVKNLREKLRQLGSPLDPIQTIWGVGYKFEVKV